MSWLPDIPSTLSVSHPAPYRLDAPWTVESRERVTCPDCGQPAFQEPTCRVLDRHGNLLREERPIACPACKRNDRPKPGQSLPTCRCGCGLTARHGRQYRTGHEPGQKREEGPMSTDISLGTIIAEAKASAAIDQAGPRTALVCPCGCGHPVKPGRKLAGKPCIPRYNRGRKIGDEARARMQAAAKERVKRDGCVIKQLDPPKPLVGDTDKPPRAPLPELVPAGLAFLAVEEVRAALALHYLRLLPNDRARSGVYQLACQMEVANDA